MSTDSTATMPGQNLPAWATADAYLFDIDGTLLNGRDAVQYFAFRHAVREIFALDATIDGVLVHGNTDVGILRAVLRRAGIADPEIDARLPHLVASMCDEVRRNAGDIRVDICPSIPGLLARLRDAGKVLGVASGNLESIGWAKLEAAGLRDFFSFGAFSDRQELRENIFRDGIARARAIAGQNASVMIVGDTPSDIEAARKVGASIVSVATGKFTREQLSALGPDLCVSCCTELL